MERIRDVTIRKCECTPNDWTQEADVFLEPSEKHNMEQQRRDEDPIDHDGSTTSTSSLSSSSLCEEKKASKHVSFTALHIRTYSQILGDHPCCSGGPPLALGWDCVEERMFPLNDYETSRRGCRRQRDELRLSLDDRRQILSAYSDRDVRRVQRKLHRDRINYGQARRCADFFFHPQPQE